MTSLLYRNSDGEIFNLKAFQSIHKGRWEDRLAVVGIPVSGTPNDRVFIQKFAPNQPERPYAFLNWLWELFKTREQQRTCTYEEFLEYADGIKLRLVTCDYCGCEVPIAKTYRDPEGNFICPSCKDALRQGAENQ